MDSRTNLIIALIPFYKTGKNEITTTELFNALNAFSEISISNFYANLFFLKTQNILRKQKANYFFDSEKWIKILKTKDYQNKSVEFDAKKEWWDNWGKQLNAL